MANRSAACMICLTSLALLLITSSLQLHAQVMEQAGGSSSLNMKLGGGKHQKTPPSSSPSEYVPVRSVLYRSKALPAARTTEAEAVGYQPFELCDGCRCCSTSNASSCVDTSCCYSIDCNIPGKPFGTCAFTPHTCGCGDTNCTQPS